MAKAISVILTLCYFALITWLSFHDFSKDELPLPELPFFDKLVHFCFYFGLNFLILFNFICFKHKLVINYVIFATVLTIIVSACIEYTQQFVGRDSNIMDLLANSVGAIAAIGVINVIYKRMRKFQSFKNFFY